MTTKYTDNIQYKSQQILMQKLTQCNNITNAKKYKMPKIKQRQNLIQENESQI